MLEAPEYKEEDMVQLPVMRVDVNGRVVELSGDETLAEMADACREN